MSDHDRIHSVLEAIAADALTGDVTRASMADHLSDLLHLNPDAAGMLLRAVRAGTEMYASEYVDGDDPYQPTQIELAAFIGLLVGDRLGFDRAMPR